MDKSLIVNGFRGEFLQVVLNIFNNARDILVSTDIDKKLIVVTLEEKNGGASLEIQDNAGGVPVDILNKIFDPYFTTKSVSGGTGIGLYMCLQIIKDHFEGELCVENNELEYENKKYIGAKFSIQLPMKS
jgi:signal transduction histidine kinase